MVWIRRRFQRDGDGATWTNSFHELNSPLQQHEYELYLPRYHARQSNGVVDRNAISTSWRWSYLARHWKKILPQNSVSVSGPTHLTKKCERSEEAEAKWKRDFSGLRIGFFSVCILFSFFFCFCFAYFSIHLCNFASIDKKCQEEIWELFQKNLEKI